MQILTKKQKQLLLARLNKRIGMVQASRAEWAHEHLRQNLFSSLADAQLYWDLENQKILKEVAKLSEQRDNIIYIEAV